MLWDSERDHWVYSNPSGSSYSGGMLMSGPRASSLGNEQGTLNNFVMKGQGGDHITSSQIIDDGTTVRIPGNLQVTGSLSGSSAVFSSALAANNLTGEGQAGAGGVLNLRQDAIYLPKGNGYSSIASSFSVFEFYGYTGASTYKNFTFGFNGLTDNTRRDYILPDGSGTLALTGDLINYVTLGTNQSISGAKTFSSPLTGSSATFSSSVTAGTTLNCTNTLNIYKTGGTTLGGQLAYDSAINQLYLWNNVSSGIFSIYVNSSEAFKIAANGTSTFNGALTGTSATFSSSVTVNGVYNVPSTSYFIGNAAAGYRFNNAADTLNLFVIRDSGNVGIGTNSPSYLLQVQNGDIAIGNGNQTSGNFSQAQSLHFLNEATTPLATIKAVRTNWAQGQTDLTFSTYNSGMSEKMRITSGGTVQPAANGTQDLGTSSLRWATVFTSDLSMSNGIGDYTIVEGEEDLFLYNNKTNKVFKFLLAEVDPSIAPPKKS
jgi:hypothetical protein